MTERLLVRALFATLAVWAASKTLLTAGPARTCRIVRTFALLLSLLRTATAAATTATAGFLSRCLVFISLALRTAAIRNRNHLACELFNLAQKMTFFIVTE